MDRLDNIDNGIVKIIIKRDGREEDYSPSKLDKVLDWACEGDSVKIEILKRDTEVTLKEKVKVKELYDSLLNTAISKISPLQTTWEFIAGKLYLLKMYSDSYGIKDKKYPHLKDIIKKGVDSKVYSKEVAESFLDSEIEELNNYIRPYEDYTFTYNALKQFNSKYCKKYSKTKKLELPQVTYMRVAMGLAYNLPNKVEVIKKVYDILTKGQATVATPIMMNSMTPLNQFSSCILNTIGNDTWDITNKLMTAGLYTKGRGGLAFDVTHIQAKGTLTNNGVTASGIVPYIKDIEAVVNSFMQGDERRGSGVVTCAWWHLDIEDFLELKDASSGTPETRALHLKYSLGTNDYFMNKVITNEDVYLFCPKDAESLLDTYGDTWVNNYMELLNKKSIHRKKINARDLYKKYLKYRFQTGNIYEIMLDNVNKTNMLNRYVGSSNLCSEVLIPSRPAKFISEHLIKEDDQEFMVTKFKDEEIGLCNLSAFNINIFDLAKEDYEDIVYTILLVLDNTIDIGKTMRVGGNYTNQNYRYVGLGVSNYAYNLASKSIDFDSYEAEIETFKLFQRLHNSGIRASARLAKEKGAYPKFKESKWAEGVLPYDLGNKNIKDEFNIYLDLEDLESTRNEVKAYGVRNALLFNLPPTASSATSKNLTESIEPIMNYSYRVEGAVSCQVLAPDLAKFRKYYNTAYNIDPKRLVKLGAIRQIFIDQSQSMNMYIDQDKWNYEYLAKLHIYAWQLGINTLYYLFTPKSDAGESCESCSS